MCVKMSVQLRVCAYVCAYVRMCAILNEQKSLCLKDQG